MTFENSTEMLFRGGDRAGSKNNKLDGVNMPHGKWQLLGNGTVQCNV